MNRVGFIGWRGMVGSVLMERMREERDFDAIDRAYDAYVTQITAGKEAAGR